MEFDTRQGATGSAGGVAGVECAELLLDELFGERA
ncbi:hypothetical protein ElP_14440 [Tautonia plasticadhaerens]|uniref:Uncharacterized protein n=1 Tax=Tautonia plasticadhaerens TaxID=2527974 RepID=A0A518GYA5_9BACT|nr:hypothetical protein ElP_14440 [Tautonia plasticadhaerens]